MVRRPPRAKFAALALILLPLGALRAQTSSVSGPPMELDRATRVKLYASMSGDLRNLVTAQEQWFASHSEYAKDFARGAIKGAVLKASPGVTVTLTYVTKDSYAARATHDWMPGHSCVLRVGAVPASRLPTTTDEKKQPQREGVPVCDSK